VDDKTKNIIKITLGIIALIGIILIIIVSTRNYYSEKPKDILHYEKIRDELTINKTIPINETTQPEVTSCQFQGNTKVIFDFLPMLFVVFSLISVASNFTDGKVNISRLLVSLFATAITIFLGMQVLLSVKVAMGC
jgi:hypothetical protein